MTQFSDDLFAACESYLNGNKSFDELYGLAVEQMPVLHENDPDSSTSRLAALIVATEGDGEESTLAEFREHLRAFMSEHAA